ncbi:MAG: UDP-2,3-diacylglucosamine diphosphatase [Pseudomonadota bacterium]|nr:UDP-2,3-diacylglucosamine diphosphatase [Pseudomonadota bacterium]
MAETERTHYRTIFISDVHLGTAGCQAEKLTRFLKSATCDDLYLVGDIVDGWKLKKQFFWPQEHTNVVRKILTKSKRGTRVHYVTGNHDEFLRKFVDYRLTLGNIRVVNEAVHETADGRRLLILHGDLFDVITRYHRTIALAGDVAYEALIASNRYINFFRRKFGLGYWSLSNFAKHTTKRFVNLISSFEDSVAHECRKRGFDGIVCGHIHHAEIRDIDGVTYYNTGDWVESCTALVEHGDGRMEILDFSSDADQRSEKVTPIRAAAAAG